MASCILFNIVHIAVLASHIIYMKNSDMQYHRTSYRLLFLRYLEEKLSLLVIKERALNVQVTL